MMSLIALVGATWAYWDMLTQTKDETITLGEGDQITVSESTASSTLKLVPTSSTVTPDATETTSVTYTYDVTISQRAINKGVKKLTVTIDDVKIGGSATYASLVNFVITNETYTFEGTETIQVTVTVTLTEPANQTEYIAIANKSIAFKVVFTGTVA